jgi:hypothetical protein
VRGTATVSRSDAEQRELSPNCFSKTGIWATLSREESGETSRAHRFSSGDMLVNVYTDSLINVEMAGRISPNTVSSLSNTCSPPSLDRAECAVRPNHTPCPGPLAPRVTARICREETHRNSLTFTPASVLHLVWSRTNTGQQSRLRTREESLPRDKKRPRRPSVEATAPKKERNKPSRKWGLYHSP